jgi:hypothetical protein
MAIMMVAILGVISLCLLAPLIGGNLVKVNKADVAALWIIPLILALFWMAAIGFLLGAINMGLRRAALAVTGGSLLVIQTGIFGSKRRQWEPGDVEAIACGPSGLEVNSVPVLELQIHDGGGKFGLLSGRSDAELEWIASELRQALGVGPTVT